MSKIIKGDLIHLFKQGEFDVIVHGCNCFCTMGSGIAKQLKKHFPQIEQVDKSTISGDISKLGNTTVTSVQLENNIGIIVNGYTQYRYGTQAIQADYAAIRRVFKFIKNNYRGKRIGYPKIGAGLAGGDWNIINEIISEELKGENHTLVVLE